MTENHNIVINFDGFCNLCSFWVRFINKRDVEKKISFINNNKSTSIAITINNKTYYRSNAILKILENISIHPIFRILIQVIPSFILNILYDFISKNRYFFFGKRTKCYIPTNNKSNNYN